MSKPNYENNVEWKEATVDGTKIKIPISFNDLKEISFRVLGTDQASFGYISVPKKAWLNDGAYEIAVHCFNHLGGYVGYAYFKVTTKNSNDFEITASGNYTGIACYYK